MPIVINNSSTKDIKDFLEIALNSFKGDFNFPNNLDFVLSSLVSQLENNQIINDRYKELEARFGFVSLMQYTKSVGNVLHMQLHGSLEAQCLCSPLEHFSHIFFLVVIIKFPI